MRVADIVALCPESEHILAEYGLQCFHCSASDWETLEEGCLGHGFEMEEIEELVDDLNVLLDKQPQRPQILEVTLAAAEAIRSVATSENRTGEGLAVIVDGRGGFCMEFKKDPEKDDKTFQHPDASDVRIFASTTTLGRIGGSTIDFRDGRFKLDLPEDEKSGCGCGGGSCGGGGNCGCKTM
jgi:hybrid cluster-associated redox disulfide protein